ncbi:MAG: 30S ribosomal protein S20 [bacterium]
MAKLKTGRHTSALKETRKNITRHICNKSIHTNIRSLSKKLEQAISDGNVQSARTLINDTFAAWDKAAKKNIVHWKNAARTKSRLALKLNKLIKT